MHPSLKMGIALTTLCWIAVGIWLTAKRDVVEAVGIGTIAFGWICSGILVAPLLASPFIERLSRRGRVLIALMMLPGVGILIACVVGDLDGHNAIFARISILHYGSLIVWVAAFWNIVKPNPVMQTGEGLASTAEHQTR